jgi:L-threonylcarbamoyladenylate synthase
MQTLVTKDIDTCAKLLLQSQLVVFPTETVYGLGAMATDPVAVSKVYKVKNRPADNPLICHVHSFEQILEYTTKVPEYVQYLIQEFSPGPISYILNIPESSPLIRPKDRKDMIFRIPDQSQTLELIRKINLPLAGPSSNLSGRPSHTSPEMVLNELDGKVAAVLDGGESEIGLESTILDCKQEGVCKILRPGAIGEQELQAVFDKYDLKIQSLKKPTKSIIPGNKYPHYSPQTPVMKLSLQQFLDQPSQITATQGLALLATTQDIQIIQSKLDQKNLKNIIFIYIGEDLSSYSHNLYNCLQAVDTKPVKVAYLINHDWGESSLALALEDRLSKIGKDLM